MLKVGYIDEDPGQRNSFRQTFKSDFDVILFDITEDTTEDTLIEEIFNANLDILVLDFRLDETGLIDFNADIILEGIQSQNLYYPIVILTSYELDALDHIPDANLVNGKEEIYRENGEVFKKKIVKVAIRYKRDYETKLARLEELVKKQEIEGLLPTEEDEFVELNSYIDKIHTAGDRISRSFYSESTNARLDNLIKLTEDLIKQLPDG